MLFRQSLLKTWQRCALIYFWEQIEGLEREEMSASTWGTCMHEAVMKMEMAYDWQVGHDTFTDLWDKAEYDYLLPRTSHKSYLEMGQKAVRDWWFLIQWESDVVLAREYQFTVPIGEHELTGTIDKLALRTLKHNEEVVLVSDYKDLSLDTRLPTPTGWTTMGDVRMGDLLIGGDGQPCSVIGKSEVYRDHDCYRVTFDDGSSVVAGADHLWEVHPDTGMKIMSTEDLRRNLINPITGQRHLRIPLIPIVLSQADLDIDPYVLGAWLGDGYTASGVICKPCPRLFQEIERRGFTVGPDISGSDRCEAHTIYGLNPLLRNLGVLGNKHIPDTYLRASTAQRLDLLRGIMDTDGHWNSTRKRCVLNTTDEHFAQQVYELVVSLGWKAATFVTTATGFGKTVPAWQTWFTPVDAEVFLARCPDGYRAEAPTKARRRLVVSVDQTLTVSTQCVMVDSPDSTYLCGDQMVLTHNTNSKAPTRDYLAHDLQFTSYAYATTQPEFWVNIPDGQQIFEKYAESRRFGEWCHLRNTKRLDAGPREQYHYNRLHYAVDQIAQSITMGIFPPNISGEACEYCTYRKPCGLPSRIEEGLEIAPSE